MIAERDIQSEADTILPDPPPVERKHDHMLDMPVEAVVWHYRRLECEADGYLRTCRDMAAVIAVLILVAVVGWLS